MALVYKKLSKYPQSVRRLLGIEMNQLHSLVDQLTLVSLSKSYPGRKHDFAIFKEEPFPPPGVPWLADSGYPGI
ncbi:MAG TPA: hypothetical protein VK133_03355 [Amoebophilaceae bacterium]|jgi:hypothetical protein|nr:hypothetical protein [Amoebophilaceae bacterium]